MRMSMSSNAIKHFGCWSAKAKMSYRVRLRTIGYMEVLLTFSDIGLHNRCTLDEERGKRKCFQKTADDVGLSTSYGSCHQNSGGWVVSIMIMQLARLFPLHPIIVRHLRNECNEFGNYIIHSSDSQLFRINFHGQLLFELPFP